MDWKLEPQTAVTSNDYQGEPFTPKPDPKPVSPIDYKWSNFDQWFPDFGGTLPSHLIDHANLFSD